MATIDQNKIRKTAQLIRGFAIAIMGILPLMLAWYWVDPFNSIITGLGISFSSNVVLVESLLDEGYLSLEALTMDLKIWGFLISALPLAFFLLTIFQVYRLMGHFAAGHYITTDTV
ncbi:MAG: hypothetical protein V3R64_00685, partial [Sphingomonadales bacterium]